MFFYRCFYKIFFRFFFKGFWKLFFFVPIYFTKELFFQFFLFLFPQVLLEPLIIFRIISESCAKSLIYFFSRFLLQILKKNQAFFCRKNPVFSTNFTSNKKKLYWTSQVLFYTKISVNDASLCNPIHITASNVKNLNKKKSQKNRLNFRR